MTVSKTTTTLEKAREYYYGPHGGKPIRLKDLAEFADSLTAELQKENARLREALQQIQEQHVEFNNGAWYRSTAGVALSKEKK